MARVFVACRSRPARVAAVTRLAAAWSVHANGTRACVCAPCVARDAYFVCTAWLGLADAAAAATVAVHSTGAVVLARASAAVGRAAVGAGRRTV